MDTVSCTEGWGRQVRAGCARRSAPHPAAALSSPLPQPPPPPPPPRTPAQYLAPPHVILRRGLIEGRIYPLLHDHLATFLARTLFSTSLLAVPSDKFRWGGGGEVCA